MWIQVLSDMEDKGANSKTSVAEIEGGKLIKTVVTSIEGEVAVAQTFITVKKPVKAEELKLHMIESIRKGTDSLPMSLAMHLQNITTEEETQFHKLLDFLAHAVADKVNLK